MRVGSRESSHAQCVASDAGEVLSLLEMLCAGEGANLGPDGANRAYGHGGNTFPNVARVVPPPASPVFTNPDGLPRRGVTAAASR